MKVFRVAIIIFVVICIVIVGHSYIMTNMGKTIGEINKKIYVTAQAENWETVLNLIKEAEAEWGKYSFWAALSISTEDIEQLEISLSQAKAFAILGQKPDFFGEFIMFAKLVEHIPHREGFHIEEIL